MERKTIKSLDEMSDSELFVQGLTIEGLQNTLRHNRGDTIAFCRAQLFMSLAALSKRFINEGVAFEAVLSEAGMKNVSAAIYALQWSEIYYQAETKRQKRLSRGYWRCLWDALLNR